MGVCKMLNTFDSKLGFVSSVLRSRFSSLYHFKRVGDRDTLFVAYYCLSGYLESLLDVHKISYDDYCFFRDLSYQVVYGRSFRRLDLKK